MSNGPVVRALNIDSKEGEWDRCMRESDRRLFSCKKESGRVWRDYMERIMNEGND